MPPLQYKFCRRGRRSVSVRIALQKARDMSIKQGIYPGSFDPVSLGHIDVVERSLKILDRVVIAVSQNAEKKILFSCEERVALIREIFSGRDNIEVDTFDKLLVNYVKERGIDIIIRGLRAVSDFDYEFQMVLMNRNLNKNIETIFLMPKEDFFYISSSVVKEVARLGGDVSAFVSPNVERALKEKLCG